MTQTRNEEPITYGNWQPPRSAGFGDLGLIGSGIAVIGPMVAVLLLYAGQILLSVILLLIVGVIVGTLMFQNRHGLNVGQRIGGALAWRRTKAIGAHLYQSGPLSAIPYGEHRLPGIAAQTRLTEHLDSWDRPFALLEVPATGSYSTIYSGEPDAGLNDQRTVDNMVDHFGGWLAGCADEPDLIGASVTIESRPDTGARLHAEVDKHGGKGSAVSRRVMQQMADSLPAGSSVVRAWATTTFSATPQFGGKRRSTAEMAVELSSRVPVIADGLRSTGAGAARPTSARELCEAVRTAYDPDLAATFDAARAAGEILDFDWADVGPTSTHAERTYYLHEDALSVTWYMSRPPKGVVRSGVLSRLLSPQPGMVKRVTLLYRPLDVGDAADVVEADLKNATYRVKNNGAKSVSSAANDEAFRKAQKTAEEEAQGAAVTNFALIVTATVTDTSKLREVKSVVSGLTRSARLLTRIAAGSQQSAFAFGLPLGLIPSQHVSVPEAMRKRL